MTSKLRIAALTLAVLTGTVGYAAAQDYGYDYRYDNRGYDRDHDRDDNRYDNFRRGNHNAREFGFRDGAETARQDMWHSKPFNPYPRGRNHADHGYRNYFGNRYEYREHYTAAYREGYESVYRGNGYGNGYYR